MRPDRAVWCLSTTEVFPFSKIGGLGDYAYSFAGALHRRGFDAIVYSPYYEKHMLPGIRAIELEAERRTLVFRDEPLTYECLTGHYEGITFVFFRYAAFWGHDEMFRNDCTRYNENLNGSTLLGKAIVQDLRMRFREREAGSRLIVQGNDAPAAFFAPFLQAEDFPNVDLTKLYCIHSFVGEAVGRIYRLDEYYLDRELKQKIAGEFDRRKTWLEVLAPAYDRFMTVSPNYAAEIAGEESPLGRLFRDKLREGTFRGFLNGLEHDYWSVFTSPWIDKEAGEPLSRIKRRYKSEICSRTGLSAEEPLLLFVGRLTMQKGLRRVNDILQLEPELRIVVLGQGEPLERFIEEPYRRSVIHYDRYEEKLCHRLLAAADYTIVPSEYEPCGYVAMHAPRFGAIPFLRRTGGLADIARTIEPMLPSSIQFDTAEQFIERYRSFVSNGVHELDGVREALSSAEWRWEDVMGKMEHFVLNDVRVEVDGPREALR